MAAFTSGPRPNAIPGEGTRRLKHPQFVAGLFAHPIGRPGRVQRDLHLHLPRRPPGLQHVLRLADQFRAVRTGGVVMVIITSTFDLPSSPRPRCRKSGPGRRRLPSVPGLGPPAGFIDFFFGSGMAGSLGVQLTDFVVFDLHRVGRDGWWRAWRAHGRRECRISLRAAGIRPRSPPASPSPRGPRRACSDHPRHQPPRHGTPR